MRDTRGLSDHEVAVMRISTVTGTPVSHVAAMLPAGRDVDTVLYCAPSAAAAGVGLDELVSILARIDGVGHKVLRDTNVLSAINALLLASARVAAEVPS